MNTPYTILNPHVSDFWARPLAFVLVKRKPLKKYGYLISVPVSRGEKVNMLVNGAHSGLIPDKVFKILPGILRFLWLRVEIKLWLKSNDLKGKVNIYYSPEKIKDKQALVFVCFRNHAFPKALQKSCRHFKISIGHLSHYFQTPAEYSSAVKDIPNFYLASDVDVSANSFFQKYFSWYTKPIVLLPFAVSDRFVIKKEFEKRQAKAVATGTFHMIEHDASAHYYAALRKFANANTVHPLRRKIFEKKEEIKKWIDCYCYPYFESNVKKKKFLDYVLPKKLRVQQATYFSFDIVDKYNDYKYAIVGEEFYNGLPGIGAFEAMACGTVLIGHPDCYKGTGLIEGEHFLPHHNDLHEIINTIELANQQKDRIKTISQRAASFVKEKYNPVNLTEEFTRSISSL